MADEVIAVSPDWAKRAYVDGAKYKNSSETPLYSKSRVLYGLNWAKADAVNSNQVIVCEGYATGASIHEATGQAVAVAFNAGNLQAVAVALRAKYPCLTITIASDDDWKTAGTIVPRPVTQRQGDFT